MRIQLRNSTSLWVTRLDSVDLVCGCCQFAVGMPVIRTHRHYRERRALPEFVVLDLRDGHIELLQPVLDASEHHALVLEGPSPPDVQFDAQEPDRHRAQPG
jgi:hypothetical protein